MNSLKRFFLGFMLGIGVMYWYLHHAEIAKSDTMTWISGAASKYRGDKDHQAAKEVLGER